MILSLSLPSASFSLLPCPNKEKELKPSPQLFFLKIQLLRPRLHALVDGRHTARQILVPLTADHEPGVDDHVAELFLGREPLDALDQVLVAVPIARDQLADQRDRAEGPLLVDGVEERVLVGLAELEAGEHAAGLQDAVGLAQRAGDVGKVADAEGDGVQVHRGVGDGGGGHRVGVDGGGGDEGFGLGQVLGVGLDEAEGGLLGGGERLGALLADRQHGRVDVADGDAHVRVAVDDVCCVEHAEGDVAGAAGDVEDVLRGARVGARGQGAEAWVEGGDEVVPGGKNRKMWLGYGCAKDTCSRWDIAGWLVLAYFHTRCHPKDMRSFMRS